MNVKELLLTSDGVYKKFILLALTLGHVANLRGKEEDLSGEGPHQGGERALTASAWALIISCHGPCFCPVDIRGGASACREGAALALVITIKLYVLWKTSTIDRHFFLSVFYPKHSTV